MKNKFSKHEAVELLGAPFTVKKTLLKKYPGADMEYPILEFDQSGVIDSVLHRPKGIMLGLLVDEDFVEVNKSQFDQHLSC